MKKVLIVAHYSRFLVQFELNDVKLLRAWDMRSIMQQILSMKICMRMQFR